MKRSLPLLLFPLVVLSLGVIAPPVHAANIISFNVADSRITMATTDLAGASGVRVGNWNNFSQPNGTATLLGANLKYEDGTTVGGLFVATSNGNNISSQVDNGTINDARMYSGNADMQDTGLVTISLSDIPFSLYDIYIYARGTTSTRGGSISLTGGPTYYVKNGARANDDGSGYVLITSTSWTSGGADVSAGNYARFENLSGANQTITLETLNMGAESPQRMSYAGFQIVQVPEPTSVALLLAGTGLLCLRRRRRD